MSPEEFCYLKLGDVIRSSDGKLWVVKEIIGVNKNSENSNIYVSVDGYKFNKDKALFPLSEFLKGEKLNCIDLSRGDYWDIAA